MNGEIAYIEAGSFRGNDGQIISFHEAVVNGRKYRFYGKKIAEKKAGDVIEFDVEEKGEGKTPKGRLKEEGGQQKQWQTRAKSPEELELERYKLRGMILAYAKDLQVAGQGDWQVNYPDMLKAVFSNEIPEKKEDVSDFKPVEDYPEFAKNEQEAKVNTDTTSQGSITPEQLSAITGGFARLKIKDHKGKVKTIIGTAKMPEYLTKAEGKLIILQINKELDATGL